MDSEGITATIRQRDEWIMSSCTCHACKRRRAERRDLLAQLHAARKAEAVAAFDVTPTGTVFMALDDGEDEG